MENIAKKITEKIIDTKFDEFITRIETIDSKAEGTEALAKQNQNSISNLIIDWVNSSSRKIRRTGEEITYELEENNENQVNMLVIIGTKNQEKTWNNTLHVLSNSLGGLLGWNPNQFLSEIEWTHRWLQKP